MRSFQIAIAASALTGSAALFTCPSTYSAGPCFTQPMNWTDAQKTCEKHGSNLATVTDATLNAELGAGGCFSEAPWNDWQCTWVGANDLISETAAGGAWEWPSGAAFSFEKWGQYDPDGTAGNAQDCATVCHGGDLTGYIGDFWVDQECQEEYAFCCDPDTFVLDTGTAPEDSFLHKLAAAEAAAVPEPTPVDPNPYDDRRLCFSTKQTWEDAQSLCQSVDSNLITIHNEEELEHVANTVLFSRVSDSWGLDWKCFWSGWSDREVEGTYTWISKKNPGFVPTFGPFEAGNGAGEDDDCVAVCKPDCPAFGNCTDLGEYGYTGTFLIDTSCADEYSFCCDGLAAEYVAAQNKQELPTDKETVDPAIIGLAVYAGIATMAAVGATVFAVQKSTRLELHHNRGSKMGGGVELSMLDNGL